jgi:hypothetical protein
MVLRILVGKGFCESARLWAWPPPLPCQSLQLLHLTTRVSLARNGDKKNSEFAAPFRLVWLSFPGAAADNRSADST